MCSQKQDIFIKRYIYLLIFLKLGYIILMLSVNKSLGTPTTIVPGDQLTTGLHIPGFYPIFLILVVGDWLIPFDNRYTNILAVFFTLILKDYHMPLFLKLRRINCFSLKRSSLQAIFLDSVSPEVRETLADEKRFA